MAVASKTRKIFDNRYEILSIVGRGSGSVVYHARHVATPGGTGAATNAEVALKVLVDHRADSASSDKLRKEALAMVSARHRYVLRLDDFHSVGSLCYLCLEYAPESDLRKYTQKLGGKLGITQAELFFSQSVEALGFVHKAGILHRDIKPDNILVINHREIRLGDFGIALMPGESTSLEELQAGVGTMSYMAPEVLEAKPYDQRADLYSLGVAFYELLSGVHPFDGAPIYKTLDIRKDVQPLIEIAPQVPQYLSQIIMKTINFDVEDRFIDADELLEAIDRREVHTSHAVTSSTPSQEIDPLAEYTKELPTYESPASKTKVTEDLFKPSSSERESADLFTSSNEYNEEQAQPVQAIDTLSQYNQPIIEQINPYQAVSDFGAPFESAPENQEDNRRVGAIDAKTVARLTAEETVVIDEETMKEMAEVLTNPNSPLPSASHQFPGTQGITEQKNVSEETENTQVASSGYSISSRIKKLALPVAIFTAALCIMVAKQLSSSGNIDSTPQISSESKEVQSVSMLPTTTAEAITFPNLPAGVYNGSVSRLVADLRLPLTIISLPESNQLTVIIGIEGWTPKVIALNSLAENSTDGEMTPLKVASNGFILEFIGTVDGDQIVGTVRNRVTGEIGSWQISRSK